MPLEAAASPVNCRFCQAENDESAESCRKCGKGLYALVDGSVLAGRYEILQPLGKGGMGLVYKARDRDLREIVAIKVLRSQSQSPELFRRFRSEIRFARRVRHPNVCAIHEFGQDGHLQFIVMEHVGGVDLKHLLRRHGPFPPEQAFDTVIQAARGLEAVHSASIVHRDLKTANIMRDVRGVVRLMDFGIAKQFEGDSGTGATMTGQVLGTPEYMSPEQARGHEVDLRTDIYALGVVLYELLTGDVPFRGDTPVATLLMHIEEPPVLIGPKAARIPPSAVPVLECALAKARQDRYGSARAMLFALQEALVHHPPISNTLTSTSPATSALALTREEPQILTRPSTPVPTAVPLASPSTISETSTWVRERQPGGLATPTRVRAAAAVALVLLGVWTYFRKAPGPGAAATPVASAPSPAQVAAPPTPSAESSPVPNVAPAAAIPVPVRPVPSAVPTEALGPPVLATPRREQEIVLADADSPVALTWKGTSGTASYSVVVSESRNLRKPLFERQGLTASSLEVRGLSEGRYYWQVEAVAPDGAHFASPRGSFLLRRSASEGRSLPEKVPASVLTDAGSSRPSEPATSEVFVPAPATAAPQASAPTPTPAPAPAAQERGPIENVLERYRLAIEGKDLVALKEVWPDLPYSLERTIREGFRLSQSHRVNLRLKDLAVSGDAATATCDRSDEILSKEGRRLRNTSTARFILRKNGTAWLIQVIN